MWSFIVPKDLSVCCLTGSSSRARTTIKIHWRADSIRGIYLIDLMPDVGETSIFLQVLSLPAHDDWLRLKDIIALYPLSLDSERLKAKWEVKTNLLDDPVHNIDMIFSIKVRPISVDVSIKLMLEGCLLTFFRFRE